MRKKKISVAAVIAGIFLFCLWMNAACGSGSEDQEGKETDFRSSGMPSGQETAGANTEAYLERVMPEKPEAELDGNAGELSYRWFMDVILIDKHTLLLSCDCYFPEEKLQQKIFYLAGTPDLKFREVYRQDSRIWEEKPPAGSPEVLEQRMIRPKLTEAGYIYETDGVLCCLDKDFRSSVPICDIRELMGEQYLFSPWIEDKNKCDVTADASKMLACTDKGLYEYDLKKKNAKLLEPAVFTPYEIIPEEGDCMCGETGFTFSGPIEAEYSPDGNSYVFQTGTEYGDATGIVLKSLDGETLYQKEWIGSTNGFRWTEAGISHYLAVFYQEEGKAKMDRIDTKTGETESFDVPEGVFYKGMLCVAFLDAETMLFYPEMVSNERNSANSDKLEFEVCRISPGEKQAAEAAEIVESVPFLLAMNDYTIAVIHPAVCMPAFLPQGAGCL